MRGSTETKCLNKVIESFKHGTAYFCCYDKQEIINIVVNIDQSQKDDSRFPDFTFANGFIEHFQISGKKENSKGSEYNIREKELNDEKEAISTNFKKECLNTEPSNKLVVESNQSIDEDYSHEYFINSFKRQWNKHINSLNKYDNNKEISIFMIEYKGATLTIKEGNKFIEFYKIYKDKQVIEFISSYKNQIKYVIYIDNNGCQIIEIKKVIENFVPLPNNYEINPGRMINRVNNIFLDMSDEDTVLGRR